MTDEKANQYERPTLFKVGKAEETILGACGVGFDLDSTYYGSGGGDDEFQSELDLQD